MVYKFFHVAAPVCLIVEMDRPGKARMAHLQTLCDLNLYRHCSTATKATPRSSTRL